MGTILLCAVDPADRAIARTTFVDRKWYVLESSPEDLPKVVGAVQLDAVVVIGNAETHGAAVKVLTAEARLSARQIVRVRYPTDACTAVTQVSGITRSR